MGRPLRILSPNLIFHILNRGNNRQEVFCEPEDFDYYLELLKRYKKEFGFKLYHFCLMPNHIHFMIEPTQEGNLPKFMQRITLAQTWFFNKKYGSVGHVWQGRYKSSLVDKENYFIWAALYIELNPARAKLVENPADWRWSSFRHYASEESDHLIKALIDIDPCYLQLGNSLEERQYKYQKIVNEVIKDDFLKNIRKQLDEGVVGTPDFIRTIKEKFKIKSLKSRGRPKKEEEK